MKNSPIRGLLFSVAMVTLLVIVTIATPLWQQAGSAQRRGQKREPVRPSTNIRVSTYIGNDSTERTIAGVCETRRTDPKSTIPIDDMARTASVPLSDPRVIAAQAHAQSLLTVAKRLVPFAVRRISMNNGVEPLNLRWMITRVQAVKYIRADVAEHDNAAWRPTEPDTIRIGTIFLLGLRSDEALIAVLGHELTHAINGPDEGLEPMFAHVSAKADHAGRRISLNATAELTCELVGLEVARDYVSQTKGQGLGSRQRLARALQKDCVVADRSDEDHLSPRETMRSLLSLQPSLMSALPSESYGKPIGKQNGKSAKGQPRKRKKR